MTRIINTPVRLRRDTSANWASKNPVLADGEVGVATDLNQFKIGTGSVAWTSLSYANVRLSDLTSAINSHSSTTTNIHGIADTNLLATKAYADTKKSEAISTANSHADSVAATAKSEAITAAEAYADSIISTSSTNLSNTVANTYLPITDRGSADGVAALDSLGNLLIPETTITFYADALTHSNTAKITVPPVSSNIVITMPAVTSTLATTAYVDSAISGLIASAPSALNTLKELADAIADDSNYATTVINNIATAKSQAQSYADTLIADLIGGAPADRNTLKKLADAIVALQTTVNSFEGRITLLELGI